MFFPKHTLHPFTSSIMRGRARLAKGHMILKLFYIIQPPPFRVVDLHDVSFRIFLLFCRRLFYHNAPRQFSPYLARSASSDRFLSFKTSCPKFKFKRKKRPCRLRWNRLDLLYPEGTYPFSFCKLIWMDFPTNYSENWQVILINCGSNRRGFL